MNDNKWPEFAFRCNGAGGCVIVERIAGAIVIRDSKNPTQPGLVFSRREYADFRRRVRNGSALRLRLGAWWLRALIFRYSREILRWVLS